eukprot:m.28202 g.28202  ORF g.28202 m.28202 type:complete len:176 (-) comp11813_c0_seq3:116-643(-)
MAAPAYGQNDPNKTQPPTAYPSQGNMPPSYDAHQNTSAMVYPPQQGHASPPHGQQQGYPPQQQSYPPQQQGYPPQQQGYPQHQQQPYQQQHPPHQQYAQPALSSPPLHQQAPGLSEADRRTAERRRQEKESDRKMLGLICGGCLCCLCVGVDRAADMGTSVADFLLCMHVNCWGF